MQTKETSEVPAPASVAIAADLRQIDSDLEGARLAQGKAEADATGVVAAARKAGNDPREAAESQAVILKGAEIHLAALEQTRKDVSARLDAAVDTELQGEVEATRRLMDKLDAERQALRLAAAAVAGRTARACALLHGPRAVLDVANAVGLRIGSLDQLESCDFGAGGVGAEFRREVGQAARVPSIQQRLSEAEAFIYKFDRGNGQPRQEERVDAEVQRRVAALLAGGAAIPVPPGPGEIAQQLKETRKAIPKLEAEVARAEATAGVAATNAIKEKHGRPVEAAAAAGAASSTARLRRDETLRVQAELMQMLFLSLLSEAKAAGAQDSLAEAERKFKEMTR